VKESCLDHFNANLKFALGRDEGIINERRGQEPERQRNLGSKRKITSRMGE
jgi:adenylate kinase